MPPTNRPPSVWPALYQHLRGIGPGVLISWESIEQVTGRPKDVCRATLTRARQELESVDQLVIGEQNKAGIRLVRR